MIVMIENILYFDIICVEDKTILEDTGLDFIFEYSNFRVIGPSIRAFKFR
jgi:hypothetical protein